MKMIIRCRSSEVRLLFIIICRRAQPPSAFWEQGSETPYTRVSA